jgi:hypothetical protein
MLYPFCHQRIIIDSPDQMRNRAHHPNEPRDRCKRQRISRQLDHDLSPKFVPYMFYIHVLFSLQEAVFNMMFGLAIE